MKILIVEDEILIANSLKKLLEKKGASVTIENNGRNAITTILDMNFDRILCDLMLQDITGFDVIEESKKKYTLSQISKIFIIMTAYSSESVINKASEYKCAILRKPFDDILEALNIILTI